MKKLFLTWQDKESRKWYPIGQLTFDGEVYRFFYIKGAETAKTESNFQEIVSFPDLREIYESTELFPMFANRVMPSSRPEYKQTIEWLALPENTLDPLAFIARSGGTKVNDRFEMFCYPEPDENKNYSLHFFAHGLRHLTRCSIDEISSLEQNEMIYIAQDFQNPHDKNALQLHTLNHHIVGYCPNYLLDDINEVIRSKELCNVQVERVNDSNSPLQFRLLCKMTFAKKDSQKPFQRGSYEPIVTVLNETVESKNVVFA